VKKIISLILCAAIMFGTLATCITAKEYYGGRSADTGVNVDGVVSDGEYSWTSGAYDRNANVANEFYVVAAHSDTETLTSQWWMSYDEEYIYVAYKERGGRTTTAWIDLNPGPLAKGQLSVFFTFSRDNCGVDTPNTEADISSVAVYEYAQDGTRSAPTVSDYVIDQAGSWFDDNVRNINTVEFKLSRAKLAAYSGLDSFDQIGIRSFIQSAGEAFYANENSSALALGSHANKGYHIVNLAPEPAATVDGIISTDEYRFTSGQMDTAVSSEIFSAYYPANDTEYTAEFLYDFDEENIYIAYIGERETKSSLRFYIGTKVASGGRDTYRFVVDYNWDPFDSAGGDKAFETYNGTITRHIATKWTADKSAEYTGEALTWEDCVNSLVGGNFDNNMFNTNVIELSVKRSALGDIDNNLIGISAFIDGDASGNGREGIWGATTADGDAVADGAVAPYNDGTWTIGVKAGYHLVDIRTYSNEKKLAAYGQKNFFVQGATAANTPVPVTVDGTITKGEYNFSSKTTFTDGTATNPAFITVGGADTVEEIDLYVTHDETNVYFGVKVSDTAPIGNDFFYVNVGGGNKMGNFLQIYLPKYGIGDLYGNIELWPSGKTNGGQLDKAKYISSSSGAVCDGGYVYEVAVNKETLKGLCGVDTLDYIFYDGYMSLWEWEYDENGEQVLDDNGNPKGRHADRIAFGFKNDALTGNVTSLQGDTYAHVLYLYAGDACDTHSYDGTETAYVNATQHKCVCNVCGYIEYAAHTLNVTERVEPTYTSDGYAVYECVSENGSCGERRESFSAIALPEDKHLLTLTAQEHVFVAKATAENSATPTVDGTVTSGEYNFTKLITPENGVASNVSQLQSMRVYFTYDDETVYVAAVVTDNEVVVGDYVDCIDIHFNGSDDIDAGYHFYVTPSGSGAFEWSTTVSGGQTNKVMSAPANAARALVVDGKTITYEVSIDRTAWGLDGNKMFLSVSARSTAGAIERLTYGFLSDQIAGESVLHNAGAYPHAVFLGESSNETTPKGSFKDYLSGTSIAYTPCAAHSYDEIYTLGSQNHKRICTACGFVEIGEHAYGEGNVTKQPTCTETGTAVYTCALCNIIKEETIEATGHTYVNNFCEVCGLIDPATIPADRHLLTSTAQKHSFVVKATESNSATPTVDGIITSGEYNWSAKNINDIKTTENISDFDLYFTYDDTNVYIAAVVTDNGEYTEHKQAVFVYLNGENDISDAWRIYLTKANGTGVEHWQITDGAMGENLWNPAKGYAFSLNHTSNVYTYELSLNRADWGLTADKLFFSVTAQSTDGTVKYAFNEADIETVVPTVNGAYPHVIFLGDKSQHKDYLAGTSLAYTACEPHNCGETEFLNTTSHKRICKVCGLAVVEEHSISSSTVTKYPSFTETGTAVHECSDCVGYVETLDVISVPDDGHFLIPAGQKQFFLGTGVRTAPVADGKINAGEYYWSQTNMEFANGMNSGNGTDNRFWMLDSVGDSKYFEVYASYDENYIYLAVRVADTYTETDKVGHAIFKVSANADMSAGYERYSFRYTRGSGTSFDGSTAKHTYKVGETIDEENKLAIQDYELVLLRSDFKNGEELADTFYFSVVVQTDDKNGINNNSQIANPHEYGGEAFFGFRHSSAAVEAKHYYESFKDRLPHVLFLGKELSSLENTYKSSFGEDLYTNWYTPCTECNTVIVQDRDVHKYVCVDCGAVSTEAHTSDTWTKLDYEYHVLECDVCKTVYEEHVADENYEATVTGATLTENAYKNLHCSICNDTVEGYIPPTNGYFLGAYGQKHFFIPENETTHKIDGVVSSGEYLLLASSLFSANGTASDSAFFMSGPRGDGTGENSIEGMSIYANYDANNLYLAAKFDDMTPESSDYLYFYIGAGEDMSENIFIYFPNYSLVQKDLEIWVNTKTQSTVNMEEALANAAALGITSQGSKIGKELTYEISIPLDSIKEIFGTDTLERFYLYSKYINNESREAAQTLYFGVNDPEIPESISGINGNNYAHVVFIGDAAAQNTYLAANGVSHSTCAEHTWKYISTTDTHTAMCTVCGAVDVETGHTMLTRAAQNKTCTENGWKEHEYCEVCGYFDPTVIIAAPGHDFNDVEAKEPSCTEQGWKLHKKCEVCGYYDPSAILAPLGHTDAIYVTENVIEATCSAAGSYDVVSYCERCNIELARNHVEGGNAGDATGVHNYTFVVDTKAATCTEDGYVTVACESCLDATQNLVITSSGHNPSDAAEENVTILTCTSPATKDLAVYCLDCGEEISRNTLVTAVAPGHTVVVDEGRAPTCTETGLSEGSHCSVCNEVFVLRTPITELGHNYEVVVTPPTCTDAGYTTHTCIRCSHAYVDGATEATGHTYGAGEITEQARCYREGTLTFVCQVCTSKKTEAIEKVAHTYGVAEDLGKDTHRFTCEVCSVTRTARHEFVSGICKCGAVPETVFELGEQGQKHTYVGEATKNAPLLSTETFDSSKYNEIASLEAEEMENETEADGFFWSEVPGIGYFRIYVTYDASKIYLAAEVSTSAYASTDTMTFTVSNGIGNSSFMLSGASSGSSDSVFTNSKVFAPSIESGVAIYAVEIDRAELAEVTNMATGEAAYGDITLSAVYENASGSVTYGVELAEDVEGVAGADEVVGHALLLRSTESHSSFTATDENTEGTVEVFGTYSDEEKVEIISVSISWETSTFRYTEKYVWNDMTLTNELDTENSGWSKEPTTVTVINHSNAAVKMDFAFATSVEDSGISGKFTQSDSVDANAVTSVMLDSAEPEAGELAGSAKSKTVYFFVTEGKLSESHQKDSSIGDITITIAPVINN